MTYNYPVAVNLGKYKVTVILASDTAAIYERAMEIIKSANSEAAYKEASGLFEKIPEFKDALGAADERSTGYGN